MITMSMGMSIDLLLSHNDEVRNLMLLSERRETSAGIGSPQQIVLTIVLTSTTLRPIQAYSGQSWLHAQLLAGVGFSEFQ